MISYKSGHLCLLIIEHPQIVITSLRTLSPLFIITYPPIHLAAAPAEEMPSSHEILEEMNATANRAAQPANTRKAYSRPQAPWKVQQIEDSLFIAPTSSG